MRTDIDDPTPLDDDWMFLIRANCPWDGTWLIRIDDLEIWWSSRDNPETFGLYATDDIRILAEAKATRGNLRRLCSMLGKPLSEAPRRR